LLDALRARRSAETAANDNLKTLALCEAAYEAASTLRSVAAERFLTAPGRE